MERPGRKGSCTPAIFVRRRYRKYCEPEMMLWSLREVCVQGPISRRDPWARIWMTSSVERSRNCGDMVCAREGGEGGLRAVKRRTFSLSKGRRVRLYTREEEPAKTSVTQRLRQKDYNRRQSERVNHKGNDKTK